MQEAVRKQKIKPAAQDTVDLRSTLDWLKSQGDLIEDEIVHVFGGRFDGTPDPDPQEVADWAWKAPDVVARDVDARPDVYTVWFRQYRRQFWDAMVG